MADSPRRNEGYWTKSSNENDSYEIPPRSASPEDIIAYGNRCISNGDKFLKGQPAYADILKGRDLIHSMATYDPTIENIPEKLSKCRIPRIKKNVREIVATLANLRPTWSYVSNNPAKYESQANVLNKLNKSWYYGERVDRSIRQALQFAATEGTGYLYMTWEKPLRAKTGRIKLTPLGASSYIPFQQGFDNKIQNAEVGIVCTEIPVQRARRIYKLPNLVATNSTATNLVKNGVVGMITNMVSAYFRASGPNRNKTTEANVPTVNIYHLYIKDDSINESGHPVKMGHFSADGKPLDNFSYTVPSIGDPIPTGRMIPQYSDGQPQLNPMTNEPVLTEETRPATAADCMLYPNLRLIIMSPTDLIYDGPSHFWHGKIPIVQFRFDDWPWNFLGFSLVRDTWRLEESINARLRARDDSMMAKLNPFLMVDSRMSDQFTDKVNPRLPGGRMTKPPMVDKPVEPMLDPSYYDVGPIDQEVMEDEKRLDNLMGINAYADILRLNQTPQSDSLEKLISASSAIVTDIARNMESSLQDLGELWKATAFQYCTVGERFRLLGDDGVTPEDFDFDPGSMIPSHLDGEDPSQPSRATRSERARLHMDSFQFDVMPNTLTQITSITRKLLFTQIWRDKSFPLDPWTYAEEMEIPNLGPPPSGAKNVMERWSAWMDMYVDKMRELQGGDVPDVGGLAGGAREGRKPSGHAAPNLQMKTDGRSTIAES